MPVIEFLVQLLQVIQRGAGGGKHVAATVIPPVLLQPVAFACGGHELPYAYRACARIGDRVVCAFDHRQQRHLHRHVALVDFLDDEIQIQTAALDHALKVIGVIQKPCLMACDQRAIDFGQGESVTHTLPQTFRGPQTRCGYDCRFRVRLDRGIRLYIAVVSRSGTGCGIRPGVD